MKKTSLGELEQQVMDIVWDSRKCTARDVLVKLGKEKKLAYTTVATILKRLYDKDLLERKESNVGYIYSAKISREKYTKNVVQFFLSKFIDSFGDTAIASFAESIDELPVEKRDYFAKLLKTHDKNK